MARVARQRLANGPAGRPQRRKILDANLRRNARRAKHVLGLPMDVFRLAQCRAVGKPVREPGVQHRIRRFRHPCYGAESSARLATGASDRISTPASPGRDPRSRGRSVQPAESIFGAEPLASRCEPRAQPSALIRPFSDDPYLKPGSLPPRVEAAADVKCPPAEPGDREVVWRPLVNVGLGLE